VRRESATRQICQRHLVSPTLRYDALRACGAVIEAFDVCRGCRRCVEETTLSRSTCSGARSNRGGGSSALDISLPAHSQSYVSKKPHAVAPGIYCRTLVFTCALSHAAPSLLLCSHRPQYPQAVRRGAPPTLQPTGPPRHSTSKLVTATHAKKSYTTQITCKTSKMIVAL
jgi:hypothetical protein